MCSNMSRSTYQYRRTCFEFALLSIVSFSGDAINQISFVKWSEKRWFVAYRTLGCSESPSNGRRCDAHLGMPDMIPRITTWRCWVWCLCKWLAKISRINMWCLTSCIGWRKHVVHFHVWWMQAVTMPRGWDKLQRLDVVLHRSTAVGVLHTFLSFWSRLFRLLTYFGSNMVYTTHSPQSIPCRMTDAILVSYVDSC